MSRPERRKAKITRRIMEPLFCWINRYWEGTTLEHCLQSARAAIRKSLLKDSPGTRRAGR